MDTIAKNRLNNTSAVHRPAHLLYPSIPGPDDPGSVLTSGSPVRSGVRHGRV